ncbi:unnamed protein product [Plutella xylostella]|uniref:(diamondback moth) hypothetical protein n=2 Tax=Plutella xylostella TaxID=51655 RepID=A0A8S4G1R8_PLUXY|nr:unnamed protein product [Plutella xylostella]
MNTEALIKRQEDCFDSIKRICVNFGKDAPERKTLEYLKKRIEALDTHWQQFAETDKLLNAGEEKNLSYFTSNVFVKAQEKYLRAKSQMVALQAQWVAELMKIQPQATAGTSKEERGESAGTFGVVQDIFGGINTDLTDRKSVLLQQQQGNFKAFQRAATKVNIDTIEEKWDLEDRLNILKTKWNAIDKIHWELDNWLNGSNELYEQEYNRLENLYEELRKVINKKMWANLHYEKSTPRVEIPEFSGEYAQWVSFKDIFMETIHNNPLISKTQKMQHLKTKLRGEAEKLVQHLTVSADNYECCWEIIQNRFDNKRLLFSSYINTLLNQPIVQQPNAYQIKRMHDTTLEALNALKNIGLDTSTWDPIVVHLLSQKLDAATYNDYVQGLQKPREFPVLKELLNFLESKFMALETVKTNHPAVKSYYKNNEVKAPNFKNAEKGSKSFHVSIKNCPLCKKDHVLMNCPTFLSTNVPNRIATVTKLRVCRNCLFDHYGKQCDSNKKCKVCNKSHHTFLHETNFKGQSTSTPSWSPQKNTNLVKKEEEEVLLTTVKIMVKNTDGNYIVLRALLDQGSQVSLITENAAQRLRLARQKGNAVVSGVGSAMGSSKGLLTLECKSIHSDYKFITKVLIMNKLINNLPNTKLTTSNWTHLDNIKLADPDYFTPGPIDLLLGADIYSEIILEGVLKQDSNSPVAQQTKLGWILCGNTKTFKCFVTLNEIEELTRFWESEEITKDTELTDSEAYCEKYYAETTERQEDGRYIVKMPLKEDIASKLGSSKPQAICQFHQLEKRMARCDKLASRYKQFIEEYIELGHMKPAVNQPNTMTLQVYLPHHGVIKESSTSTKLRVVFNASMKTSSKYSLNDLMEKGPNLQNDILTLIIKWRSYRYAVIADIEKMYRGILIHEDQQQLQKIVWRFTPTDKLREMQLCTVSYGSKSAPYLAMRTLKQLAIDEGDAYPQARKAVMSEFYMDDVISGRNTIEEAKILQNELYNLLLKGGFVLKKWATNEASILEGLPDNYKRQQNTIDFKQDESMKTLGLSWNTTEDVFVFNWQLPQQKSRLTKRVLLSNISKIYDPLGWLSPMTVKAKLIFQKLWLDRLNWDENVSESSSKEWELIRSEIININDVTIPRWISCYNNVTELHGFCDASEKAFACVIYSKATNDTGEAVITLMTAKTKVAPTKKKTTLPRLELCGAQLLAKLMNKCQMALTDLQLETYCWTDSQVVLAWLQGDKTRWDRYVANRSILITNLVPASKWSYVNTKENPADCATRGLSPKQLVEEKIWWNGPQWLKKWSPDNLKTDESYSTDHGLRQTCTVTKGADTAATSAGECIVMTLLNNNSRLEYVTRVIAYLLRWEKQLTNDSYNKYLSISELNYATEVIIRAVQRDAFAEDIEMILKTGLVHSKSKLLNLSPFLDKNGVLRVGGRLQFSALPSETKHPMILPHGGRLTELVIQQAHELTLHGGARLTLAQTRQRYWIVGGNRAVKKIIRLCMKCRRYAASKTDQIMGNLPTERITPSRPFTNTGVDFTGHVDVKINKGRGVRTCKGYIAIFICMSTKAVHIELVSDLTTQSFIMALKRLCARRGVVKSMFSDNGKNFVGAAKELQREFQQFETLMSPEFFKEVNKLGINWHFNAPLWPSAGGLWEAAVKSMKFHLKRVLGEQKLTYEEFTTLLHQIEACMNSRPLCPITEDPEDLEYLTPGHFLTGGPIMSLPQEELTDGKHLDLRNRWKYVELMHQHFWKRWSSEYLHQLQTKSKWLTRKEDLEKGDLVLVKEKGLPPGKWALGRITEVHPGADGCVRVVTLKTQNNTVKRPITKLTPLPMKTDNNLPTEKDQHKSKETDTANKLKPRTKRSRLCNFITTLMLTLMIFPTGNAQTLAKYQVTPFEANRPMYFDEIAKVQVIHDEWIVLVYYNLTNYWQTTEKVQRFVDHLSKQCGRLEVGYCSQVTDHLQHEIKMISENNMMLLTDHSSRKKRGYINGVGSLARTLFGVLDQNFADKYAEDIQKLQMNDDYQVELMRNQTLIIEAENSLIKSHEKFINSQFQTINKYINETESDFSKIENRLLQLAVMNELNAESLTANLLIADLKQQQEMLTNALTDVLRGHLDMRLFTPSQLIDQLSHISSTLQKRLSFPVKDLRKDINNLYKLIYVKARITNYMLFELHIPLISDDEYVLYRTIPVPMKIGQSQLTIRRSMDYIATNFVKNTYIAMDELEVQQCITTDDNNILCHARHPIYNLYNKAAPCEAKLLSQGNALQCNYTQDTCSEKWIKLHKPNHWIFVCCDSYLLRIMCGGQVKTSTTLNNTGMIVIGQDCFRKKILNS